MGKIEFITICAFVDDEKHSIKYKIFSIPKKTDIKNAVEFYEKMLNNPLCNVISTRKVRKK